MSHSNQIREYLLGPGGVTLIEPYIGPHGVLTGSARIVQEAQEEAAAEERRDEVNRRKREFVEKRKAAERQILETREALQREEAELLALETVDERKEQTMSASRFAAATRRGSST
jgi:circadian clock protein KaiC